MKRRAFLRQAVGFTTATLAGWPVLRVIGSQVDEGPLRILFLTDLHAMSERGAPDGLRLTAEQIQQIPADVIIGGGDFVHGGYTSDTATMEPRFALCAAFLKQIGRPVEAILGNHDMVGVHHEKGAPDPDPTRSFREMTGTKSLWRTFDVKGRRFFVVQSVEPVAGTASYRGRVSDEQMAWLKSELASTPKTMPLILCSHIPLRTTFKQIQESPLAALPENLVVGNANDVLALFDQHRLELVLQGHLHFNEFLRVNQTAFLVGGAVCGAWWDGSNLGTPRGFGLIELGADPRWTYLPTA